MAVTIRRLPPPRPLVTLEGPPRRRPSGRRRLRDFRRTRIGLGSLAQQLPNTSPLGPPLIELTSYQVATWYFHPSRQRPSLRSRVKALVMRGWRVWSDWARFSRGRWFSH
jgi:hypothetical protein